MSGKIIYKIIINESGKTIVKEIKSEKELNDFSLKKHSYIQNTTESLRRYKVSFEKTLLEVENAFK